MSPALYRQLNSPTETRLVKLLPGPDDSPLAAELVHIDLNEKPCYSYEAVSYAWGPAVDEQIILLDGSSTTIRHNLWSFLRRLRAAASTDGRALWIDALSINQLDLGEKSRQVQMIGNIFKQAKQVLAWVGEHADSSEALFQPWPASSRLKLLATQQDLRSKARVLTGGLPDGVETMRMKVWLPFLRRSYWNRTWIVQELVLAQSIIIYCGSDCMDWSNLVAHKQRLWWLPFDGIRPGSFSEEFRAVQERLQMIILTRELRYRWQQHWYRLHISDPREGTVLTLATQFGGTECSDRQDRIYALLWLERRDLWLRRKLIQASIFKQDRPVEVSYDISVAQLFVNVCKARLVTLAWLYADITIVRDLFFSLQMVHTDAREIIECLLDDEDFGGLGKHV